MGRKNYEDEKRAKVRSFRLTDADYQIYINLGGVDWLKKLIRKSEHEKRSQSSS